MNANAWVAIGALAVILVAHVVFIVHYVTKNITIVTVSMADLARRMERVEEKIDQGKVVQLRDRPHR